MDDSLWDTLPIELQEIIFRKSVDLCRQEWLEQGRAKHERHKKKQGRGMLSVDMIEHLRQHTDTIEILNWGYELELRELETKIDPPTEELSRIEDHDYHDYYDTFLERCVEWMSDETNKDEWVVPGPDHFLNMYTRLLEFKNRHGHTAILTHEDGSPGLHLWLELQKDPETHLSRERRHALQSVGIRLPRARR